MVDRIDEEDAQTAQGREDGERRMLKLVRQVAERIRADSRNVQLTATDVFFAEPFSLSADELDEVLAAFGESEQYEDIEAIVESDERSYLYASDSISRSYAQMMVRRLRNDPVRMIADTVREESELYPRSTAAGFFGFTPFSLSPDEIDAAVGELLSKPEYADIHAFEASTGATYLFSDRSLTEDRAREHAEWVEVGQYEDKNQ